MRLIVTITLIVIFAIAIDTGRALWGGRRRRRRRRCTAPWLTKTLANVGSLYKKHKRTLKPVEKALLSSWGFGKDVESQLSMLKNNDQESYDNFIQLVRADLENEFPNEDVDGIMKKLDQVTDMEPDDLFLHDSDYDQDNHDVAQSERHKDMEDKMDALNLH